MQGVETQHPEYANRELDWRTIRDCVQGQRHIKALGNMYLKKTSAHKHLEKMSGCSEGDGPYGVYKDGARFPDIVSTISEGLAGLASRKPWIIEGMPSAMDYLVDDAGNGIALDEWQGLLISEGLRIGRYAMFPDAPVDGGEPRIAWYPAESVINWKTTSGRPYMVVLKECIATPDQGIFSHDMEDQYRVIRMEDGRCFADVYNKQGDLNSELQSIPLAHHEGYCPVVIGGSINNDWVVDKPPMIAVADCAVSFYRLSAQQRFAIRQTCDPMFLAKGFKPGEIKVWGSGSVFEKETEDCAIEVIEVKGDGIDKATEQMRAEIELAEKSSHQLTDKASAEASDTTRQRTTAKTATLRSVDRCAASSFQKSLNMIARMKNLRANITVTSSYDYTDQEIEATVLTAITNAVDKAQLPKSSTIRYVKSRGMHEGQTVEELELELEQQREEKESAEAGFGTAFDEKGEVL